MEAQEKANCWEFEQCGLEPGGKHVASRGVCPAAVEQHADGIHHGRNAGRCCWVVSGTLCRGGVQGSYVEKIENCQQCEFYKAVRQEEHQEFKVFSAITHEMRRRALQNQAPTRSAGLNCWEFEQCGLEPGGRNVAANGNGACPAAVETQADGIHHGKNAGRCCWVVTGTLCRGEVQGSYAEKAAGCQACEFYALVRQEEHHEFKVFSAIMHELRSRTAA